MKLLVQLLSIIVIFHQIACHCPHMMNLHTEEKNVPKAPGVLPQGDKGWDFDEPSGAPGSLPVEHFIQTSFIHRSNTENEKKFANIVSQKIRQLKDKLRKEARVTIDNENVACADDANHYRCSDFPEHGSYHYLVVEDSSRGAAIYSLDYQLNERSKGTTEMAILDALSRHSPHSLTFYASPEAEKEVGFVRALSSKEIESFNSRKMESTMIRFSPLELNLLEPSLLELRSSDGLDSLTHKLSEFRSREEFDTYLAENKHVFVLFWSHVHTVSLHAFHLWAKASVLNDEELVVLAHVECHLYADFCEGLRGKDFHTIVAYRNGENIGSVYYMSDEKFYLDWIRLMVHGPMIELKTEDEYKNAKKGHILNSAVSVMSVGIFPDFSNTAFKHFAIAADRLAGRYHMAYLIRKGAKAALSTYRLWEKKRRVDYDGHFDPTSLMAFITQSTIPSVINISLGFTTDILFRQQQSILILVAEQSQDVQAYRNISEKTSIKKTIVCTSMTRSPIVDEVLVKLDLSMITESWLILLDKKKMYHTSLGTKSEQEILDWIHSVKETEPYKILPAKEIHPLRLLQINRVNKVFGTQNIAQLPDESLFEDKTHSLPSIHPPNANSGGCPFMASSGSIHEEL